MDVYRRRIPMLRDSPKRITAVTFLDAWSVRLIFNDGQQRTIDLWPFIATGPIFAPLREDISFFRQSSSDGSTLVWPNGADLDPDVRYYYPALRPAHWDAA